MNGLGVSVSAPAFSRRFMAARPVSGRRRQIANIYDIVSTQHRLRRASIDAEVNVRRALMYAVSGRHPSRRWFTHIHYYA